MIVEVESLHISSIILCATFPPHPRSPVVTNENTKFITTLYERNTTHRDVQFWTLGRVLGPNSGTQVAGSELCHLILHVTGEGTPQALVQLRRFFQTSRRRHSEERWGLMGGCIWSISQWTPCVYDAACLWRWGVGTWRGRETFA